MKCEIRKLGSSIAAPSVKAIILSASILAAILLSMGPAAAYADTTYDIVVDYHDSEYRPIPNVEFRAYQYDSRNALENIRKAEMPFSAAAVTDVHGRATLERLVAGSYIVAGHASEDAETSYTPVPVIVEAAEDLVVSPKSVMSGESEESDESFEHENQTEADITEYEFNGDLPLINSISAGRKISPSKMALTGDTIWLVSVTAAFPAAILVTLLIAYKRANMRRMRTIRADADSNGAAL